jgi:hypothetical protein
VVPMSKRRPTISIEGMATTMTMMKTFRIIKIQTHPRSTP